jgi:hypothetical protein
MGSERANGRKAETIEMIFLRYVFGIAFIIMYITIQYAVTKYC